MPCIELSCAGEAGGCFCCSWRQVFLRLPPGSCDDQQPRQAQHDQNCSRSHRRPPLPLSILRPASGESYLRIPAICESGYWQSICRFFRQAARAAWSTTLSQVVREGMLESGRDETNDRSRAQNFRACRSSWRQVHLAPLRPPSGPGARPQRDRWLCGGSRLPEYARTCLARLGVGIERTRAEKRRRRGDYGRGARRSAPARAALWTRKIQAQRCACSPAFSRGNRLTRR